MGRNPFFTIVTIAKNSLAELRLTGRSVSSQDFEDFEWVVIDGASTDGTVEYLRSIRDPRCVWRSEADSGIYDAMNRGLDSSRGQYVVFLNSGDEFASPATLSAVANNIVAGDDLLYGQSIEVASSGLEFVKRPIGHSGVAYGMFACHQSIFYLVRKARELRYREVFRLAGDYDFTARYLTAATMIRRVDFPISKFAAGGYSQKNAALGRRENWIVQRDVLNMSLFRVLVIHLAYRLSYFVRRFFPGFYVWLRRPRGAGC